ncbi:MAG: TonB-dependent receptor [Vicinamibacterales bacterium]
MAYASGTNRIRGSAWEFMRRTDLNATGFFKPSTGVKPQFDRDQFGGVLGGPILRNKAFFFADVELFRQTRGQTATTTIATLDQRQGLLSVPVRNPLTGVTYPAGTPIPMTAFARKVLGELPDPSRGTATNNLAILQEFTNDTNKAGGKVDFQLSPRLSAFGRYGWRDANIFDTPNIPGPSGGAGNAETYVTNKQFAAGVTYTPNGRSLLEIRMGWSRTVAGKNPYALFKGQAPADEVYGITGLPSDPRVAAGLPTQLITGYSDLGRQATNPQWQYPEVWNPKVNYSWIAGRHSLKSGYEYQKIYTEVQDVNPLYGRDQYSGQFSRPAGAAASNLYNLADFMFGQRSTYALSNILVANLEQDMHFLYLQDDWRVNDRLTVNLGLRYEYATPWVEENNVLSNFDPDTLSMRLATDGSLESRSTIKPDRNNLGPRLGLAYTLNPSTVVRGGYGVSYVHFHRAGGANVLPINGPQVINAVVVQTPGQADFRTTEQGYPAGLTDPSQFNPLAANITYMPRDYHSSQYRAGLRRCSASSGPARSWTWPTGQPRRRPAALRQLQPGASQQQRRYHSAAAAASDSGVRRHHLLVQRREVALPRLPGEVRLAHGRRRVDPQLADAVEDRGQRRRFAGEPERQLPGAAGHQQSRCRLRPLRLSPAAQQHDERGVRPAGRSRPPVPVGQFRGGGRPAGRLAARRHQYHHGGRVGDAHLHAGSRLPGVGHPAGLPGRQQLPSQRDR